MDPRDDKWSKSESGRRHHRSQALRARPRHLQQGKEVCITDQKLNFGERNVHIEFEEKVLQPSKLQGASAHRGFGLR